MKISAVLASYNHAPYLRTCIDSMLNQTRPPDEIIVVDDESTDESREIIDSYGDAVQKIYHRRHGTYGTLNVGIRRATGDWIAIHNSDDVWDPCKLERQEALLREYPEVGLVHTSVKYIDASGQECGYPIDADLRWYHAPPCSNALLTLIHSNCVSISSAMFSRKALDRVGLFDERYLGCGDWDLCLKISKEFPVGFVDAPLTYIRRHRGNAGSDPDRIPGNWMGQDWNYLGFETMPKAAEKLLEKAWRGEVPREEAAFALACLGTQYTWGVRPDLARKVLRMSIRLQPARLKTCARYLTTFLPHKVRSRIR